jgi:hypothetical protein
MEKRRVETSYCGAYNRPLYETKEYCPYCEWKGDAGAGKELQELIRKNRNGL